MTRLRIFLLLLGISFALNLLDASQALRYPYQLDYEEGYLLHNVYRQARGEDIYSANQEPPYNFVPYPPVYSTINILLGRLVGFGFLAGRLVSFLSSLLIGFIIYKISSKFGSSPEVALFSALIFLTSTIVFSWSLLYRVDMLALLFSAAGFYLILGSPRSKLSLITSPILFLLAFFTKPFFITAPFVAFWYLFTKNTKKAWVFAILLLAIGGSAILLLQRWTNGLFLVHSLYYHAKGGFSWTILLDNLSGLFVSHPGLVAFAFLFAFRNLLNPVYFPLSLYFLISILLTITVGKPGASHNYFLELIFLTSLFGGFLMSSKFERYIVPALVFLIVGGVLIKFLDPYLGYFYLYLLYIMVIPGFLLLVLGVVYISSATKTNLKLIIKNSFPFLLTATLLILTNVTYALVRVQKGADFAHCLAVDRGVAGMLASVPAPVISENSSLLPLETQSEPPIDLCLFSLAAEAGIVNEKPFLKNLRDKNYSLVVLEQDIDDPYNHCPLTRSMISEVKRSYRLRRKEKRCEIIFPNRYYHIFVPKN